MDSSDESDQNDRLTLEMYKLMNSALKTQIQHLENTLNVQNQDCLIKKIRKYLKTLILN